MKFDSDDDQLKIGFLLGILVCSGYFGGDGQQPDVTLRMHTKHEELLRWLEHEVPGGKLYGPYNHSGRRYFQWMVRGRYLREVVAPLIHRYRHLLDEHAEARFYSMCERYRIELPEPA